MSIAENLRKVKDTLPQHVTLVAVSKTKPTQELLEAYQAGQRDFGENRVQEIQSKWPQMPKDIRWHMIGHLQRNKVKYIAEFVHLVHSVDSLKLLEEIDKQAAKYSRVINCLLQIHIATETTKFGMSEQEATALLHSEDLKLLSHVRVVGLMGMATFTGDREQIDREFAFLKRSFDKLSSQDPDIQILSMGMSGDYSLAISHGSNMVRIGSSIFGSRTHPT